MLIQKVLRDLGEVRALATRAASRHDRPAGAGAAGEEEGGGTLAGRAEQGADGFGGELGGLVFDGDGAETLVGDQALESFEVERVDGMDLEGFEPGGGEVARRSSGRAGRRRSGTGRGRWRTSRAGRSASRRGRARRSIGRPARPGRGRARRRRDRSRRRFRGASPRSARLGPRRRTRRSPPCTRRRG